MPRETRNNPTERMERLLFEMEDLERAYDDLASRAAQWGEIAIKPNLEAYREEKVRQKLTYKRNKYARGHMQRARILGKSVGIKNPISMKEARDALIARDSAPLEFSDNSATPSVDEIQAMIDKMEREGK